MKIGRVQKVPKSNFHRFFNPTTYYFHFVGVELQPKQSLSALILKWFLIGNMCSVLLHQLAYLAVGDVNDSAAEYSASITFVNYYIMTMGKIVTIIIFNRKEIGQLYEDFRRIYPTFDVERTFHLESYEHQFTLMKNVVANFFKFIAISYLIQPLAHSVNDAWGVEGGSFSYRTPLYTWHPIPLEKSWLLYGLYYVLEVMSNIGSGQIVLGCDVCLFGSVLQLCLHLDLLTQRLLQLKPTRETESCENLMRLKALIRDHQEILRLSDEVNRIFTPSLLFSLASSSFIICFACYRLVDEKNNVLIGQTVFLILYELKQVVITCYFGNKLIDASEKVFTAVYEHNWYNGSIEYKRLVLTMLLRTRKPIALKMSGISDVSLVTLKQVLRLSYQVFTVLKCKRDKQ